MKNTCGIFLYNYQTDKFLLGHVTGNDHYSIPKGVNESNEPPFMAAIRELKEETNIDFVDLSVEDIIVLPKIKYNSKKKRLHPYLVLADFDENSFDIKCNSIVEGHSFLELDGFVWATIEECLNKKYNLHPTQIKTIQYIKENNLLNRFSYQEEIRRDFFKFSFEKDALDSIKQFLKPIQNLSIDYIIDCVLDEDIQKNWEPKIGDCIMDVTGSFYVITHKENIVDNLGGDTFYCSHGYSELNINKFGFSLKLDINTNYLEPVLKGFKKLKNFRYIPYPHIKNQWMDIETTPPIKGEKYLFKYIRFDDKIEYGIGHKGNGFYVIGSVFHFDLVKKFLGYKKIEE